MLFGMIRPATIVHAKPAVVWLRIVASLAWLESAFIGPEAKVSATFLHGGLAARINATFMHTAADSRIVHLLATTVLPHVTLFAAAVALADATAGMSLLFGCFTRIGAVVAIARALVNIAVAFGLGADTVGYNCMLAAAAAICLWTGAGRKFGVDEALLDRFPKAKLLRIIA